MPQPGDYCAPNGSVDFTNDGRVLVCRGGTWQRVGEASPARRRIILDRLRAEVAAVSLEDVTEVAPEPEPGHINLEY